MSLALSRRLSCRHDGSAGSAIQHWLKTHPDAPVAAERLGQSWLVAFGYADGWGGCAGLGLHGPEDERLFAHLDTFFARYDLTASVIVSPYADPSVTEGLAKHGYQFRKFRHLMVRKPEAVPTAQRGVIIRPGNAPEVLARGFCEGADPGPGHRLIEAVFDDAPGTHSLVAICDGAVVGGGRVALSDGLALLYGSSVLPAYRRRGVHSALLRARVQWAHEAGCDTVAIECTPGSPTERNAVRLGFRVAFTQAIFSR